MRTREKEGFLVLNGTQTQSARVCNLLEELPQMQAMAYLVRLSPPAPSNTARAGDCLDEAQPPEPTPRTPKTASCR